LIIYNATAAGSGSAVDIVSVPRGWRLWRYLPPLMLIIATMCGLTLPFHNDEKYVKCRISNRRGNAPSSALNTVGSNAQIAALCCLKEWLVVTYGQATVWLARARGSENTVQYHGAYGKREQKKSADKLPKENCQRQYKRY